MRPSRPFDYLSLEERDILETALYEDVYPIIVKFLQKEVDNMGQDLILSPLEPTNEAMLKVAYIKAKLDGARHLLSRFQNLKPQLRGSKHKSE